MLGFQNRAPDIKLFKFYSNRNNQTYLEKHDFQWKLFCQILYRHWICGIETSLGVVLDLDSAYRLALHAKRGKTFNY